MRIKHEDAVVLEAIVRRTFNCERGGMGGFVDADHFEREPFDAAIIAIAPLWQRSNPKEIEEFLFKWESVLRDENIKDADIHTYINEFRSLMSRLTDRYTEKKNYRQILHDGIRLAEIPENMLLVANHKVTINNNSIVFTWGTQGIYYRKTFTDVRKITTAEEVEQIILENLSK